MGLSQPHEIPVRPPKGLPPLTAVIPVLGKWAEFTRPLLEHLRSEDGGVDRVIVLDNGSPKEDWDALRGYAEWANGEDDRLMPWLTVREETAGIYALWNQGFRDAAIMTRVPPGPFDVAVLNNDIRLHPGSLTRLQEALRKSEDLWVVSPDPMVPFDRGLGQTRLQRVSGTYRHGGMAGFCFVMKGEVWDDSARWGLGPFDEEYLWWYGDDDFAFRVETMGGRIAKDAGVPIHHVSGGSGPPVFDLDDAIARDRTTFAKTWPQVAP